MGLPVFRSGGFSVGCSAGLSTCAAATHAQRKPAPNTIESLMLPELYRFPNVRKNTSWVFPCNPTRWTVVFSANPRYDKRAHSPLSPKRARFLLRLALYSDTQRGV